MKTDVEELSPTRVRLTIEVPFEELRPNLDQAYREVARQVRIPGFRPGRVPPRVIDQRVGRGAVLEQAVNEAVPQLYGKALAEHGVFALGQPDLEITRLDDGTELTFTAEVDIRPRFELPDLDGMPVTVDDAEVTPDQVEEYLGALRERFASLKGADRPAAAGDFVSIDLAAAVDGKPVEDAQATGISYEVGSGSMLDGLDEALAGMEAGQTKIFPAELAGGKLAGMTADVSVTVNSVKTKDLPELDDEFAQSASEFDTVGELRAGTRKQLETMRRAGQAGQARERALDALINAIEIPLPEKVVDQEVENRWQSLAEQLDRSSSTMEDYLGESGMTREQLQQEFASDARRSVKAGFILDKLAVQEELGVEAAEVNAYVTEQAYRLGVPPDRLAKQLTDHGQLNAVLADVLRTKALGLIAARAAVTDETGREVDISPPSPGDGQAAADGETVADGEAAADGETVADGETAADGETSDGALPDGTPSDSVPAGAGEAADAGQAGEPDPGEPAKARRRRKRPAGTE